MKRIMCLLCFSLFALTLFASFNVNEQHSIQAMETVSGQTPYVAITFDDGPRADTTGKLLQGLSERNVRATFFVVGEQIAGNEELIERMAAAGHQVGNHTYTHLMLKGANSDTILQEVNKTNVILTQLLGEDQYWLRPPYGLIDEKSKCLIKTPMIAWSIDPEDWKKLNTDAVVKAVLHNVKDGDIILLHDFYPTSVDAALIIIDELKDRGFEFVTVKELMQIKGIQVENGKIYRNGYSMNKTD